MVRCSVVTLCVASVCALTSVALVGIAFSTDNWVHISVNRFAIRSSGNNASSEFYDRVKGFFRVCYPHEERPDEGERMYLNPVEEWCTNVDYSVRLLGKSLDAKDGKILAGT